MGVGVVEVYYVVEFGLVDVVDVGCGVQELDYCGCVVRVGFYAKV